VYSELAEFLRPYGFKAVGLFRYEDYGDAMWIKRVSYLRRNHEHYLEMESTVSQ